MMSDPSLRVLLIEDHAVLAQGLRLVLVQEGHRVHLVGGDHGAEVILAEAAELAPHVVLLDLHLGNPIGDTTSLIEPLRREGAAVIVLTGETDPAQLGGCLEAGAAGVVLKTEPLERIVGLVPVAAAGGAVMPPTLRSVLLTAAQDARSRQRQRMAPFDALSRREAEVLEALTRGRSAEQVAEASYVSIATVRSHISSILRKLRVSSQLQAVALARDVAWTADGRPAGGRHPQTS